MWVLIIVLWQSGASPSVAIAPMPDKAHCAKLLTTFVTGEAALNEDAPSWFRDKWNANCEFRLNSANIRT